MWRQGGVRGEGGGRGERFGAIEIRKSNDEKNGVERVRRDVCEEWEP